VASRIVGPLLPGERMLLARRPTSDPAAYDHFLRGNWLLASDTSPDVAGAIAEFEAALRSDSAFANAFSRLALGYATLASLARGQGGAVPESLVARGLAAVNRAMAEDSLDADAWLAAGWLLSLRGTPQDLALAPEMLRRAVVFGPGNGLSHEQYGLALLRMGRFDDAEPELTRALELEPGDPDAMADLGWLASIQRTYGLALRWFEKTNAEDSTRPARRILSSLAQDAVGDAEGALADARAALAFSPPRQRLRALAVLAEAESRAGNRPAADSLFRRALRDLEGPAGSLPAVLDPDDAWPVAHAAVQLGNKELALSLLARARPRGPGLWDYLILEGFDPIRADPRFQTILDEARPPGARDPA